MLVTEYNYAAFTAVNVAPLMCFADSPPLGRPAPDFPLWTLANGQTTLSDIWREHDYTVVEFGSFT